MFTNVVKVQNDESYSKPPNSLNIANEVNTNLPSLNNKNRPILNNINEEFTKLNDQNQLNYNQQSTTLPVLNQITATATTKTAPLSSNVAGYQNSIQPFKSEPNDNKQNYFFVSTKPTTTTTPPNFYNLWQSDAPTTPKGWTPYTTKEMYKLITTPAPEIISNNKVKTDKYGKANSS